MDPFWKHTHGPTEETLESQHGPDLHTHGDDGKVETILGKPHRNPMRSRCGLEDCDCGYVIELLVLALEDIVEHAEFLVRHKDPLLSARAAIKQAKGE